MMDGKLILGFLNYLVLSLIFILGFTALAVLNQRRKLTFLFLMLLGTGLLSFLFFAGPAFIIPAAVLLIFCLILFLLINSQEYYSFGRDTNRENFIKKNRAKPSLGVIINLIVSILFCLFLGYIFFKYTQDFYKNINLVENFNTLQMIAIIENISANYAMLMLIIVCSTGVSVLWFISILSYRRKKN